MENKIENIDIFESNDINNNDDLNIDLEDSLEEESENLFGLENFYKYEKYKYILKDIIKILMNFNIITNNAKCNKTMNLTENKTYYDGYVWQCLKRVLINMI